MDITKYINSLFVKVNNSDNLDIDENKIYFLSFIEYDKGYNLVGLHIPIKIKLVWENPNYPYISYETVGDFLVDNLYLEYNEIKEYIKDLNYKLNGNKYMSEYWFSSPLIINLGYLKSPYEFVHISDNIEDIKKDYKVLKGLK